MTKSWGGKKPKTTVHTPAAGKVPRERVSSDADERIAWRLGRLDVDGQWSFFRCRDADMIDRVWKFLRDTESMKHHDVVGARSHMIQVSKIIRDARQRLEQLQQDDVDELLSLRVEGKLRLWGIRERNIVYLLWLDPEHEICPSPLKHT